MAPSSSKDFNVLKKSTSEENLQLKFSHPTLKKSSTFSNLGDIASYIDERGEFVRLDNKSPENKCFFCLKKSDSQCPWCQNINFCSAEHFRQYHRVRSRCWPIKIVENDDSSANESRRVVTTRDVRRGELLFVDKAVVVAPSPHSVPVCPGCLRKKPVLECPDCLLPVCDLDCAGDVWHKEAECRVLKQNRVKVKFSDLATQQHSIYSVLILLRMLALKSKAKKGRQEDVELWSYVDRLPSHSEERRGLSEWNMFQVDVVEFLRGRCFMKEHSEREMHRLVGIFLSNSLVVESSGITISTTGREIRRQRLARVLFPLFALLKHDCLGNAEFCVEEGVRQPGLAFRPSVMVRAREDILSGQEVTVQRMASILGTHKRRRRLRSELHVDCRCRRCSDPSELQTFLSAVVCEACETGSMLPDRPLDAFSAWTCPECGFDLEVEHVERKVDLVEDELGEASSKKDPKALEEFVQRYSGVVLHRNHYLMLLARRNLAMLHRRRMLASMVVASKRLEEKEKARTEEKVDWLGEFSWILRLLHCEKTF